MRRLLRIAIDTGGTFTDCVYRNGNRLEVVKIPSTPDDPARAILNGIAQIVARLGDRKVCLDIRHGTTVGTNALLERKGAKVAFITTEGFEDTLFLGRQARPDLYAWSIKREKPLVTQECCFGVRERIGPDGVVIEPLSQKDLKQLQIKVRASGAQSIAVSLLFGFANSTHEKAIVEALVPLGLPISASHQILPEFREYERAASVVVNAYLAPKMQSYLRGLEEALLQDAAHLSIMQSSGGILPAAIAVREPVRTILSGPAGGVMGALDIAREAGAKRVLSFDMGGTSTDVALLDTSLRPVTTNEGSVAGLPISIPMLDIHTAGAGGGSLAWFDDAGVLQVGPQSAGADPGPACYGRGDQPTVTDANLILGRIDAEHFLGGAMKLDLARARSAFERTQGAMASVETFAEGVVTVANARMESALRRISVERGHDPRGFTLLCFGGAGPLHACALADALGMGRVLVPASPGALSACGILSADAVRDFSRTVMLQPGSAEVPRYFRELEQQALRAADQTADQRPLLLRSADLRYCGQGYELRVDWGRDYLSRFHRLHAERYGYADESRPVEIVTLRLQTVVKTRREVRRLAKLRTGDGKQAILKAHRVFERGRWRGAHLYKRESLRSGDRIEGPAVIVEYSATTFVASGWSAWVDGHANLVLSAKGRPR
jgi:N-methylhydantoinase A